MAFSAIFHFCTTCIVCVLTEVEIVTPIFPIVTLVVTGSLAYLM